MWHLPLDQVITNLATSTTKGLQSDEVLKRHAQYGKNILPTHVGDGIIIIFLRQFLSPLIYILLAAAIVSMMLEDFSDAAFIGVILLINALLGTYQEYMAEREALALEKIVPAHAQVTRNGQKCMIAAHDLVPGDILHVTAGDKVPADARLYESHSLHMDESLLTGESVSVVKSVEFDAVADNAPLSEKNSMIHAGSMVQSGRGNAVVVHTGLMTEIGNISESLISTKPPKPPLLQRIERFTLNLSLVMLGAIGLITIVQIVQGKPLAEVFLMAVALAVAAVPEGLPAAITVALSIGMKNMAKQHVIIRNLMAVEALGSCTYIASDKTGTLTLNELTVKKLILPEGAWFDVEGDGLGLAGNIVPESGAPLLLPLVQAAVFANEATVSFDQQPVKRRGLGEDPLAHAAQRAYYGDMVDVALRIFSYKFDPSVATDYLRYQEIGVIPYESHQGYAASVREYQGRYYLYVKGSPEKLLAMSDSMHGSRGKMPINQQKIIEDQFLLAKKGYRVLAFAFKDLGNTHPGITLKADELTGLVFSGMVGMIDPLRPEVRDAVKTCRMGGIQVAMITGDHPMTAQAIAEALELAQPNEQPVTGEMLYEAMAKGQEEVDDLVAEHHVFARVAPKHKQVIVESLIRQGHFVAVTGDGVNDAPALKQANVGIAMGLRGTDLARESADIILSDDNFASIVKGIEQGRVVYNNIRKVVFLLLSTGAAEIIMFLGSLIMGLPMPLLPAQLLWLNLVTNGIQDISLAFEPAEGNEIKLRPRNPRESIFNRLMISRTIHTALWMGGVTFGVFYLLLSYGYSEASARNLVLLLMVLFENVQLFNCRSETVSFFRQRFISNPMLLFAAFFALIVHIAAMYIPVVNTILGVSPVTLQEFIMALGVALSLLVMVEVHKRLYSRG